MSSIMLDKFAEMIIGLRDKANNDLGPDAASRIQVYVPSGQAGTTPPKADGTYRGLANLTEGAHFHRSSEQPHGSETTWPDCVIIR